MKWDVNVYMAATSALTLPSTNIAMHTRNMMLTHNNKSTVNEKAYVRPLAR